MFAGFLGGEIAGLAGYDPTDLRDPSWFFVLVIGYIGPPAMNMIAQLGLGLMQKGLERWGLDFEKQQADNMKMLDEKKERAYNQEKEKDEARHAAEMREMRDSLNEAS